ncbi:glycosyltransferase [Thalassospira sp. ER-Se-21-Dark]|uniref:glycosyltransferase family 2 protein n=1 Tax=Thalassospira sp. ER-Se-21-Dark TaxID=2585190 RepID=UPI001B3158D4|nr:glycosyltransferase [Thalassospira sp. ER-Se-21-Dark]MBP3126191.1 glycosyltransferase [Thalassospira sp. ER-Se-21-Dark]
MSQNPLVSIVIPSYKTEFFEQTLRSAIGQTYNNTEIIVSDNCPTETIAETCQRFNGINYYRNELKGGQNILDAIFSAKGDYIKPLFDDDLLHPFCVERMVEALQSNPNTSLVFSASTTINSENKRKKQRRPANQPFLIDGKELQRRMILSFQNFVGEFSTIMLRREFLKQYDRTNALTYDNAIYTKGLSDVVFYWNATRGHQAHYLDEELSYFRFDPQHNSNSNPESNPDFLFAITDWIELLIASHEAGVITDTELVAQGAKQARALSRYWSTKFPAVAEFAQKFEDYLKETTQK